MERYILMLALLVAAHDVTIGALEYPNVYYVDPRHPAALDEPAWGYPGVPLASLTKALLLLTSRVNG